MGFLKEKFQSEKVPEFQGEEIFRISASSSWRKRVTVENTRFRFSTALLMFRYIAIASLFLASKGYAQGESGPVKIKINRIVFTPGNQYAVYVPSFEFHVLFQQTSNSLRSAVSADYDYRRQDMGFGMSHALYRYVINPGVTVEDNLYFRKVFNDSTGIWNRNQNVTPFLVHQLGKNSVVGLEFKFEKDSSPKLKEGSSIVRFQDRSMKVYYLYQTPAEDILNHRIFYVSLARSYKILKGDFNYLLLEALSHRSAEFNRYLRYKNILSYRGNLTPQASPLYFLGGHSNLIGFDNDEFWGRRVLYTQNLFEIKPFPDLSFSVNRANFRRLAILFELDVGRVEGAPPIERFRKQDNKFKTGIGIGLGFNTDLPYMPKTDIHFMMASPADDPSNVKYYAGFGGWIN
jgi:hypothetical protein